MADSIPANAAVLVIGLGRFDTAAAGELTRLDRDVLAINDDAQLVQTWSEVVTHAVPWDARNIVALRQIGAQDFFDRDRRGGLLDRSQRDDHREPGEPGYSAELGQRGQQVPGHDSGAHRRTPCDLPGGRSRRGSRSSGLRRDARLHRVR